MVAQLGPPWSYGLWVMAGLTALLGVFFLLRGRVRIEHGWSGLDLVRFRFIERLAHALLAGSFLLLALSGLMLAYGRPFLGPLIGDANLGEAVRWSKVLHESLPLLFMASLALVFVLWVWFSLPHWRDVVWLLKGGGLIVRGVHPPAWRFNLGQKLLFWITIICGVALSLTGLARSGWDLLFARALATLRNIGVPIPQDLTPAQELAYAADWHLAAGLVLLWAVIVHIILRTAIIQGAFAAMASGRVDANWARQHHRLWAERELQRLEDAAAHPEHH